LISNDSVEENKNHSKTNTKIKTNSFSMNISNSNSIIISDCILSDNNQYTNSNNNDNNIEENKMDIDIDDDDDDDDDDDNDIENNIKQTNEKRDCYYENKIETEDCSLGLPGTFLSNEIISKKILNIFQNISSTSEDKIRFSTHKQKKNSQSKTPKLSDFRILCSALIIAHNNNNTEIRSKTINNNAIYEDEEMKNQLTHTTSTMNEVEKTEEHEQQHQLQLQLQLQNALDDLNMSDVAAAVALGATVEHTHIRQSALHFGDEYVPMFCMLLRYGELYIADR
jgi:hypothetical protein